MEGLMIHAIESGVSFLVIFIFVALIFFQSNLSIMVKKNVIIAFLILIYL